MKKINSIWYFLIVLNLSYSPFSMATFSTFGICPDKFLGRVKKVKELSNSEPRKMEVQFEVLEKYKGKVASEKTIQVVKDGPVEFEVDQKFELETRERWLCQAKKI